MNRIDPKCVTDAQYLLIAARRQNYDSMLWQTPVISLTAQAFLFTIALGAGNKPSRIIASLLALITALASAQLLAKHRYNEIHYSRLLESIETAKQLQPVHGRLLSPKGVTGWSSFRLWMFVFLMFALAAGATGLFAGFHA